LVELSSTASVLIIDDDELTCKALQKLLERRGYEIEVAHSGKEGIEKALQKHHNVALIDIVLPDMGGIDLLRQLKEIDPVMSNIMVTGKATVDNAVEALNLGADAFIRKPFKPDELLITVEDKAAKQVVTAEMTQEKISGFIQGMIKELVVELSAIERDKRSRNLNDLV
jgi:DNA-binding NtrC family response regulator